MASNFLLFRKLARILSSLRNACDDFVASDRLILYRIVKVYTKTEEEKKLTAYHEGGHAAEHSHAGGGAQVMGSPEVRHVQSEEGDGGGDAPGDHSQPRGAQSDSYHLLWRSPGIELLTQAK